MSALEEDSDGGLNEVVSFFDIFKIGIGPSSSHSVGPMIAANRFVNRLERSRAFEKTAKLKVLLYGSLALTGKGHGTDTSIMMGLMGELPDKVDAKAIPARISEIEQAQALALNGKKAIVFCREDIEFCFGEFLEFHSNALTFKAYDASGREIEERTYYSIGGGFVLSQEETTRIAPRNITVENLPFPFKTAAQLLELGKQHGRTIAEMAWENELALRSEAEVEEGLLNIYQTMMACIEEGCRSPGVLPGGLGVKKRAPELYEKLCARRESAHHDPAAALDWVNLYALSVNEQNASGCRIVTAPTNGAAGIIPAVLAYYVRVHPKGCQEGVKRFLLTAAAIGTLYKRNASISGAEVGCQGEVGSACSMAAAGLTAALEGTNAQIENAAEIGMEHNLGLTCDPVGGLVQIPCIERNAMAAVKAINASNLALKSDGLHYVSLDAVIKTMWETGQDMQSKYKETSQGGLAVNVPNC